MISVKHPLEECNESQERFLADAPAGERRFHELLFSHGNATYRYHSIAGDFKPTKADYTEWLSGLPSAIRSDMEQRGFEGCLQILSFTRYVNEKNDVGLDEYVKDLMGEKEYNSYNNLDRL